MTGTVSDLLRTAAATLGVPDPAGLLTAVAWRLDQRAAVIDRIVAALATATGAPEAVVRLAHGIEAEGSSSPHTAEVSRG